MDVVVAAATDSEFNGVLRFLHSVLRGRGNLMDDVSFAGVEVETKRGSGCSTGSPCAAH